MFLNMIEKPWLIFFLSLLLTLLLGLFLGPFLGLFLNLLANLLLNLFLNFLIDIFIVDCLKSILRNQSNFHRQSKHKTKLTSWNGDVAIPVQIINHLAQQRPNANKFFPVLRLVGEITKTTLLGLGHCLLSEQDTGLWAGWMVLQREAQRIPNHQQLRGGIPHSSTLAESHTPISCGNKLYKHESLASART